MAGAAAGLVLPGHADPVWHAAPAHLVQALAMPAYQLTNPVRGHLAAPAGRKLKAALSAAVRSRVTGAHWITLLTAPRSAFGGPTSGRAEQAYTCLETMVTDYLRPALTAAAAAQFAAGLELAASAPGPAAADTTAPTPTAAPTATDAVPSHAADRLAEAVDDIVEHSAILCVTGPVPITTQAITTASQRQEMPVVWLQPHPAKDRAGLIRAFYASLGLERLRPQPRALNTAVELIATELQRSLRLVIVPDAEQLPTAALQQLYSLWSTTAPDRFPLILAGEDRLHTVLARPALASLNSCVFIRHRLTPAVVGVPKARPTQPPTPNLEHNVTTSPVPSPAALTALPAQDNTAAPTGDLGAQLRQNTETRSVLVVIGQDTATAAIFAEALEASALQPVRVEATTLDRLVFDLFKQLSLGKRRPRDPAAAVVKITAEMRRTPHPIVVEAAHDLPADALRWLHLLWTNSAYPLVLVGDERLSDLLGQPMLSGLCDHATLHHVVPSTSPSAVPSVSGAAVPPGAAAPPAPTAVPTPTTAPAAPGASMPAPAPAAVPGQADAAPGASGMVASASASAAPSTPPTADLPAAANPVVPSAAAGPATMHEARAALPQLIKAATAGTPTPLTRGTHHAVLTSPVTATGLGWDLTSADVHGTADARKKLGDLIQAAAGGRPQVLRRHTTALAVLLPAAPGGVPRPPTDSTPVPAPVAVPASDVPAEQPPAPVPASAAVSAAPVPVAAEQPPAPVPASAAVSAAPVPVAAEQPPASPAVPAAPSPASASGPVPVPASDVPAPPSPPSVSRRLAPFAQALDLLLTPHHPHPTPDPAADPATNPTGPEPLPGLAMGLRALDELLGGLQPGRFYLVAAPPGLGSSLLAATAARITALEHHQPVLYAASGLSRADVAARITAAHLPVDYRRLRAGRLNPTEQADVTALQHELAAAPLYIDDGTDLTAAAIAESADDLPGLALVVVDRLQTMDDPRLPLSGPRLTDAAQALAHLARTRNLPLLAAVDTADPDHLAALGLDITITLAPYTGHYGRDGDLDVRITERDFGTLATIALHADTAHARITDYVDPYDEIPPVDLDQITTHPHRPARSSTSPAELFTSTFADPAGTDPTAPVQPAGQPTPAPAPAAADPAAPASAAPVPAADPAPAAARRPASPGYDRPAELFLDTFADPADHPAGTDPTTPVQPTPATAAPAPTAVPAPAAAPHTPGAWPAHVRPAPAAEQPAQTPAADPEHAAAPEQAVPEGRLAPATAEAFAAARAAVRQQPASTSSSPGSGGGYAGRDYSYFTGMITRAVDQALEEHGGDIEAATEALVKKAVPNAMTLFEATRVGANYEHTVYPEILEFLRKKTRDGVDEIWEGRHNWNNTVLLDELRDGRPPVDVEALDTNAAFCSALKTHLPIGALVEQKVPGYDPKRSGVYLLASRPAWNHPHLPDPIGNRHEEGPLLLDDATIRLLARCHKLGLADAPLIAECWTSGASENLLEKLRRVLTEARETALRREKEGSADGTVTVDYIKAMYSKFVSTMGESSANLEIRRPEWMHIVRSQAFANLWYKAHKVHQSGLTVVRVRGTDELHVTGGEWRKIPGRDGGVFEEGRLTTQMKLKDRYTLPRKTAR
ncbi:DnaB-like helicase C-terminal domain-containing protein [Kitasatospora hibisci]|uniref:DnaB-like helicase C-terminal domain-containing protein n=1 Tax=Kitasatospora hibisci TaxID=3369522 RepID=UPI003754EAFC